MTLETSAAVEQRQNKQINPMFPKLFLFCVPPQLHLYSSSTFDED